MKKRKFDGAKDWNFIIVEGFCGYSFMKDKYVTVSEFPKDKNGKYDFTNWSSKKVKTERIKNPQYVNAKIPTYCKGKIGIECLGPRDKKCSFFLCSQADYDEYLIRHIREMRKYTRNKRRKKCQEK